jgi:sugar/nucleoside kinase (ribokinase family)
MGSLGRVTGGARILVVGDVAMDVVALLETPIALGSDTPAQIRVTGGGQGANTAAWLARLGRPVTLAATVGADRFGDIRLAELAELGIQCVIRRCPDAVTGTIIALSLGAERTMITQRGANLQLAERDIDAALAAAPDAGHLHLSGYVLADAESRPAGRHALALARDRRMTVSVDAASTQPLREAGVARWLNLVTDVDLLLANAAEAQELTGRAEPERAASELTAVARNVVVKLGPAGALWCGRDGLRIRSNGRRVTAVDPTGAGDAFAAGLLTAWTGGGDPAVALEQADAVGAAAVARIGAGPAPSGDPDPVETAPYHHHDD